MGGKGTSRSDKGNNRDELKTKLDKLQKQQLQQTRSSDDSMNSRSPFSNVLGKRDNRSSLPVFAGSSAHAGVINANSGEDVNFVVGLSENLLLECRRLQSENERKSSKLQTLEADYNKLKTSFERLSSKHESLTRNEDSLKDTNWQLEMKLQSLAQELNKLTDAFNKNKSELQRQMEVAKDMKTELEESSLEKMGLKSELEATKQTHINEMRELKHQVEELNNENDDLHTKVNDLREKVALLAEEREITKSKVPTDSAEQSDSLSRSLSTSENQLNPHDSNKNEANSEGSHTVSPHLEYQTLRSNLAHANQTIIKLRQKLNRSKPESAVNSPLHLKTPRGKSKAGLQFVGGKVSTPQKSIISNVSDQGSDWNSTNSPTSIVHDDSSDFETTSFISEATDYMGERIGDDFSEEEDFSHELDYEDIERYAKDHNLAIIASSELEQLKEQASNSSQNQVKIEEIETQIKNLGFFDTSAVDLKNGNISQIFQHPTEEYLITHLRDYSLTALNNDVYNSIMNPSIDELNEKATQKGFTLLAKDELSQLSNPGFNDLRTIAARHEHVVLPKDEYNKLLNPTLRDLAHMASQHKCSVIVDDELDALQAKVKSPELNDLKSHAERQGHVVLPKDEHSKLVEPNVEDLQSHAERQGHVVLPKDEHNSIVSSAVILLTAGSDKISYSSFVTVT